MAKTLGQTIIVENKPGANGNISAQYIVDQPADGQYDLGRHPGLHRDQSQRVQEPALVDRRFPAVHPRRRGAAGVRRASGACRPRPSRSSWPGPRPTAASSAIRPTARHAVALPRLSSSTRSSISISPMCPIAARACRPTALVAGHSLFGFAQVNTTVPQHAAGKLQASSPSPAPSRPARCRTCRPSPSLAIRSSPRGCGSACW